MASESYGHALCCNISYKVIHRLANIDDMAINVSIHYHGEADTLLVLHTFEIAKRVTSCECIIYWTGKGDTLRYINVGKCYDNLSTPEALCSIQ